MGLWPLSAFADEICPDLAGQISSLKQHEIRGLDLRSVDGVNVLDLLPGRIASIRDQAAAAGIAITCIGSPVNKVRLEAGDPGLELEKLGRAIEAAKIAGTRFVRVFSPEVDDLEEETDAVLAWMGPQVALAMAHDIVLLHENDARFYGAYPDGARTLFSTFGGLNFRAVYDFANDVRLGFGPDHWFPWLVPHLDVLHIKDARSEDGAIVPAGEGDGKIRETLAMLHGLHWDGSLALEPHLQAAGAFGGFSGPELFDVAVRALRNALPAG